MAVAWHTLSTDALSQHLRVDCDTGLSSAEAQRRLLTYSPNALPDPKPPSPLTLFLQQFTSVIVWVLLGVVIISAWLQEWIDAIAIVAIILLKTVLGFVQEYRAERSLAALKKLAVTTARVFRDGQAVDHCYRSQPVSVSILPLLTTEAWKLWQRHRLLLRANVNPYL